MPNSMTNRLTIGISACLLGEPVRFNGGHKKHQWINSELSSVADFKSFCPEVGIGLPVPRPTLRLVERDDQILALDSDRQEDDVTEPLKDYFTRNAEDIAQLDGFILMQGSPSCGMERVKVYGSQSPLPEKNGVGIFANELIEHNPLLPIEEAGRLSDAPLAESFLTRLYLYHEWRTKRPFESAKSLIEFHSRHKFLIMLHSYQGYKESGKLLADLGNPETLQQNATQYIHTVMTALKKVSSTGQRANALFHLLGFLKTHISSEEKQSIVEQIKLYQQGITPYVVPLSLIRHYARIHSDNNEYLWQQSVWFPYPENLNQYKNVV